MCSRQARARKSLRLFGTIDSRALSLLVNHARTHVPRIHGIICTCMRTRIHALTETFATQKESFKTRAANPPAILVWPSLNPLSFCLPSSTFSYSPPLNPSDLQSNQHQSCLIALTHFTAFRSFSQARAPTINGSPMSFWTRFDLAGATTRLHCRCV